MSTQDIDETMMDEAMIDGMAMDQSEDEATSRSSAASQDEPVIRNPGTVTIRLADSDHDWQNIIKLTSMMHAESDLARSPFNDENLQKAAKRALTPKGRGQTCALMAERWNDNGGTDLVGMLVGNAGEYYFAKAVGVTAMMFYVRPENRGSKAAIKLLEGFRKWANNRKATSLSINVTSGIHMARSDRLLRRLGFKMSGGNYLMHLEENVLGDADEE
jgi:hypothetical protein